MHLLQSNLKICISFGIITKETVNMRRKQRNTRKVPGDYLQVCRSISVSQFLHFTEQHHTNLHWHLSTIFITWNILKYKNQHSQIYVTDEERMSAISNKNTCKIVWLVDEVSDCSVIWLPGTISQYPSVHRHK